MQPVPISVHVIKATTPEFSLNPVQFCSLATVQITVPLFVWTELLTHRRLSRNASSARAMGTKRYADMGYFLPPVWYSQGEGMQSGEPISDQSVIDYATRCYKDAFENTTLLASSMLKSGIAKEQANRVIPPTKMVRGIVTGTMHGWLSFLALRHNEAADKAMQQLASLISLRLNDATWDRSNEHVPFLNEYNSVEDCVAQIARVSYNREHGKDNRALYDSLVRGMHFSPFEHIAYWVDNPAMSNFTCKIDDVNSAVRHTMGVQRTWWKYPYSGWEQLRSRLDTRL